MAAAVILDTCFSSCVPSGRLAIEGAKIHLMFQLMLQKTKGLSKGEATLHFNDFYVLYICIFTCDVRVLLLLTYGMPRLSRNLTATGVSYEIDAGVPRHKLYKCRLSRHTPVLYVPLLTELLSGVLWSPLKLPWPLAAWPLSSFGQFSQVFIKTFFPWQMSCNDAITLYKSSCSNCFCLCNLYKKTMNHVEIF